MNVKLLHFSNLYLVFKLAWRHFFCKCKNKNKDTSVSSCGLNEVENVFAGRFFNSQLSTYPSLSFSLQTSLNVASQLTADCCAVCTPPPTHPPFNSALVIRHVRQVEMRRVTGNLLRSLRRRAYEAKSSRAELVNHIPEKH